jgi:SpoU rRNA methylase family enzyme
MRGSVALTGLPDSRKRAINVSNSLILLDDLLEAGLSPAWEHAVDKRIGIRKG